LNPELRRWTTPIRDEQYELKVPAGTAEVVRARLDDSVSTDLASLKFYVVKRGDTLPLIAKKLHVSNRDLAEANYLPVTARVAAGQKLMVPHEATVLMAAQTERPVPAAESRRTVATAGQLANPTESNRVKAVYQVKRGDTLASIAELFKTSVTSLKTWNPRVAGDRIAPGQRLTVYRLTN
jgi:membrane-bound lytic murein transglycosylase D